MKNQIKTKQIAKLAKEVDQDHEHWNRLEEMQDRLSTKWLKETIEEAMENHVGSNFAHDINALMHIPGILPGDKLFLIFMLTRQRMGQKDVSMAQIGKATGYTRKGCGDVFRRLIAMGMIQRTRHGWYSVNTKNLY